MRIVAGKYRGAKIKNIVNKDIRPTTDKVKESLFNSLGQMFYGGHALDLFSGSGSLGLEALSRGMEHVTFIDKDRESIKIIKENLSKIKATNNATVLHADALESMKKFAKENIKFDLIFLDPPYYKGLYEKILTKIQEFDLLKEDGFITLEYDKSIYIEINSAFEVVKNKKYGNIAFSILQRSS